MLLEFCCVRHCCQQRYAMSSFQCTLQSAWRCWNIFMGCLEWCSVFPVWRFISRFLHSRCSCLWSDAATIWDTYVQTLASCPPEAGMTLWLFLDDEERIITVMERRWGKRTTVCVKKCSENCIRKEQVEIQCKKEFVRHISVFRVDRGWKNE